MAEPIILANDPRELEYITRQRSALTKQQAPNTLLNQIVQSHLGNESDTLAQRTQYQLEQDREAERIREFEANKAEQEKARTASGISNVVGTASKLGTIYKMTGGKPTEDIANLGGWVKGKLFPETTPTQTALGESGVTTPTETFAGQDYSTMAQGLKVSDPRLYEGFAEPLKSTTFGTEVPTTSELTPVSWNVTQGQIPSVPEEATGVNLGTQTGGASVTPLATQPVGETIASAAPTAGAVIEGLPQTFTGMVQGGVGGGVGEVAPVASMLGSESAGLIPQTAAPVGDYLAGQVGKLGTFTNMIGEPALEAGTTLGGIASDVATGLGYAGYGTAARELGAGAFNAGSHTLKQWGGASEQAGEQMDKFLVSPLREPTLEGAGQSMWQGIVGKGSPLDLQSTEAGRIISTVLDPVGSFLKGLGGWISKLTHICTATKKYASFEKSEDDIMKKLRKYALSEHNGWMTSYLNNGPKLIEAISKQEKDLEEFYNNIREILIKPVVSIFDQNNEKAFQIYLLVTQMLFSKYLPEFDFKEEKR